MQVRINGKIGELSDVKAMLETKVINTEQGYRLNKWYKRTVERLEAGEERVIVNRFGHPEIVIDNFVGTEIEYEIHVELLKLDSLYQKINSQEYADQEEVVNYLLRKWRHES